jgi:hypothetical protein
MSGPPPTESQAIQDLIDDILSVYERLVITDVEESTLELYLAATDLCHKADELKVRVERVMFGEDQR